MTTKFDTKQNALDMGAYYAGVYSKGRNVYEGVVPEKMSLGSPQNTEIEVYKIKNAKGKEVCIGVRQFRDGYDLWLIDPESGFAQRA